MQSSVWNDFLQFVATNKEKYHQINLSILNQSDVTISEDNNVTILCHNQGVKIYLVTRANYIANIMHDFNGQTYQVEIVFDVSKQRKKRQEAPLLEFQPSKEDLFSRAGLNSKYQFDNFAVSSSNQVAYAAAQASAQKPGIAYNPLFMYGGVGVGKTHLAQAVVRYILEKDNEKRAYFCPGDQFTNEFVESIREKTGAKFRRKFRNFDVLIMDDVQFIAGKEKVQEELFHTFNEIVSRKGQIILTSDKPPHEIKNLEDRLRSRFSGGMTVDIGEPDFELRTAILLIKAQEKNIEIDIEAAKLIAEEVEDTRALEGTLVSIYARVAESKGRVDLVDAENFFTGKKSETAPRKLTPNDIIKTVCIYYNVKQSYIKSPSRVENIALARQLIMYLLNKNLGMKLLDVAFFLKRRDHTTVIHARDKIEHMLMTDQNFKDQVDTIVKSLQ